MPRLPRIHIEGALYYVTCRGAHEQELFESKRDYEMYAELLKKYRQEYRFRLFAYVLLPKHIHLLIEPQGSATISEIMHVLNTSYSKYFNSEHQRRGHLFRERFKTCIVEKGPYLNRLTAHIHNNPLRVGLSDTAGDYPYSSLSFYTQGKPGLEEETAQAQELLGLSSYSQYIRSIVLKESEEFHKSLQRRGILGSKEFVQRIKALIKKERERKDIEPSVKKIFFLGALFSALLIIGAVSIAGYMARRKEEIAAIGKVASGAVINSPEDLDLTIWRIKVVSADGLNSYNDILRFSRGKFSAEHFSKEGFRPTNFSISEDDQKIIFETLQTKDEVSVSWRGEIEKDKMQGIFSLRSLEATQDFYFGSTGFRRK